VERLGDYNLYGLLDRNTIVYASLIRRSDWELAGGQDESLRVHYEDWDFWLRLGERERFGYHIPRVLFHYRKSGSSMFTQASEKDEAIRARIRANHPGLYSREGRARIKARWAPAVCVLGAELATKPIVEDWQHLPLTDPRAAVEWGGLLPLPFKDLPLGAEPVLLVLAGFSTASLVQFVGPRSYLLVRWDALWHQSHVASRAFRTNENLWLRLFLSLMIDHIGNLLG